jgi:hypothetical protein
MDEWKDAYFPAVSSKRDFKKEKASSSEHTHTKIISTVIPQWK